MPGRNPACLQWVPLLRGFREETESLYVNGVMPIATEPAEGRRGADSREEERLSAEEPDLLGGERSVGMLWYQYEAVYMEPGRSLSCIPAGGVLSL